MLVLMYNDQMALFVSTNFCFVTSLIRRTVIQYACMQHFNGHFPGKSGLSSSPLDYQSLVILNLNILPHTTTQNSLYP